MLLRCLALPGLGDRLLFALLSFLGAAVLAIWGGRGQQAKGLRLGGGVAAAECRNVAAAGCLTVVAAGCQGVVAAECRGVEECSAGLAPC